MTGVSLAGPVSATGTTIADPREAFGMFRSLAGKLCLPDGVSSRSGSSSRRRLAGDSSSDSELKSTHITDADIIRPETAMVCTEFIHFTRRAIYWLFFAFGLATVVVSYFFTHM